MYKRVHNEEGDDNFEFLNRIVLKDIPIFTQVCMNFHFQIKNGIERDTIIFAKIDSIFSINFLTGEIKTVYKYKSELNVQPQFFKYNDDQSICLVSSNSDGLYID